MTRTRTRCALTAVSAVVLAAALSACQGSQEVSFPDPTAATSADPGETTNQKQTPQPEPDTTEENSTPSAEDDVIDLTTPDQPTPTPDQNTLDSGDLANADDPRNNDTLYPGTYNPNHPWNQLTPNLEQKFEPINEGDQPPAGYIAVSNGPDYYLDTPAEVSLPTSGTLTLTVGQVAIAGPASVNYDTITVSNNGVITGGKGRAYNPPAVFKENPNAPLAIRALKPGTATVSTPAGNVTITVEQADPAGAS